jgi:hypothetical protein
MNSLPEIKARLAAANASHPIVRIVGTTAVQELLKHAPADMAALIAEVERLAGENKVLTKWSEDVAGANAVLGNELEGREAQLAERDAEVERYHAQLSSGFCSTHKVPEPLTCDMCNEVTLLDRANITRMHHIDTLRAQLAERDAEIQGLRASHRELLDEAKITLQEVGDCDHDVGICVCDLIRKIEDAEAINPTQPAILGAAEQRERACECLQ